MKRYSLFLLIILSSLNACSLFSSSPSSVVKKVMSCSDSKDLEGKIALWSNKAVQEKGAEFIRSQTQFFGEQCRNAQDQGEKVSISDLKETVKDDRARVFFKYGDSTKHDQLSLGFALLKENGDWKLYRAIAGEEENPFDSSFEVKKP